MNLTDDSTFTMPLTLEAHQVADQFRRQQAHPQKAKQVYLNTLAVQAVHHYLEWMGISTNLTASDSWNPTLQSLADVADLVLQSGGKLECRPVLPGAHVCQVPPEVWSDRVGYVAVQFNPDLTEATLLGFVPAVTTLEVPLNEWRSLDALFDYVSPSSEVETVASVTTAGITHLSRWVEDAVEAGWQTIEALFGMQQLAFSVRGADADSTLAADPTEINRGKPLTLGSDGDREQVVLIVGVIPTIDRDRVVWVRLAPPAGVSHLPPDLEVMILDETGDVVMQAQSRQTEMIQLRFTGSPGEPFGVQIRMGAERVTESFVI